MTPRKISARDEATLLRLRRRFGEYDLVRIIQALPDHKASKSPGAPRMTRIRQGLLAALYDFRTCMGHTTISAFAKRLPEIIEIKYSRRLPTAYVSYKSVGALEADLRRGLRDDSKKDQENMIEGWLFWRVTHVNPKWVFLVGGVPHVLITPKKPAEIIKWIDAAIKMSGLSEADVLRHFPFEK